MNASKIVYIDGNGVSVTRYCLKIKNHSYPLKEIMKYNPVALSPKRFFGLLLTLLGIMIITMGYISAPASIGLTEMVREHSFHPTMMGLYLGIIFILGGIIEMAAIRKRYALQIVTTEGIKNVVISQKKEYITRIIHILNIVIANDDYAHHPSIQKTHHGLLETPNNLCLN